MDDRNETNTIEFTRQNNLINQIVLVDAIGRSGKGMMAHVLSSFERIEKQHNLDIFEWIGIVWRAGRITDDAAATLLRFEGDTRLYNALLSRCVNFRFGDDTGVFKNANPLRYLTRLFAPGGDGPVVKCVEEKIVMQSCIHDGLRNAEIFFRAFEDRLKIIYIVRDPVSIVYEWQEGGFGRRIGNDPRSFQLTVRWGDGVVPYTAIGWEQEYLSISPDDRVIALINYHFKLNLDSYLSLDESKKDNVLLVSFEEFVTNPVPQCERIAQFLGTKPTFRTRKILKRENCPRILKEEDRKQMIMDIEKRATPKYIEVFHELFERFESCYWQGQNQSSLQQENK